MTYDEAYSKLTSAVEAAVDAGMSETEIRDCVDDAIDGMKLNKPHVGGGPKPKKS